MLYILLYSEVWFSLGNLSDRFREHWRNFKNDWHIREFLAKYLQEMSTLNGSKLWLRRIKRPKYYIEVTLYSTSYIYSLTKLVLLNIYNITYIKYFNQFYCCYSLQNRVVSELKQTLTLKTILNTIQISIYYILYYSICI